MKILRVVSTLDPSKGGPVEGIRQYQKFLAERGVSIEIACCDVAGSPWLQSSDLPVVHALGPATGGYGYSRRLLPWLREHASRFDAVIVHGIWQYHGYAVRTALKGTDVPYYVFTHGMLDPWFKRHYPLKHLKKWLYWPWAEYRVLRDACRVLFTSEEERLSARKSFWLYKAREAVTAYGVSNPPSDAQEMAARFIGRFPEVRGKRIALFLSRIHEKKGCNLLIEAFSRAAGREESLHLVMAGPDQNGWVSTLKAQAEDLGVGHRITWTGMLQGDLKWGAFFASEIFCLPSHQENFGIAVAEALACGKPVLISNKVNIWREIEADHAGFVADDTLEGTTQNLERWLSMDQAEFAAMTARSIACFTSHFHVQRAAEQLVEIIREST